MSKRDARRRKKKIQQRAVEAQQAGVVRAIEVRREMVKQAQRGEQWAQI